jgi:hypothetical protein
MLVIGAAAYREYECYKVFYLPRSFNGCALLRLVIEAAACAVQSGSFPVLDVFIAD